MANAIEQPSLSNCTSKMSTSLSEIISDTASSTSTNQALLLKPTPLYPFPSPVAHPSNSPTISNFPLYTYPSIPQSYPYIQLNSCLDNTNPVMHSIPMANHKYNQVTIKELEPSKDDSIKILKDRKGAVII